jgi:hypothetical protein
VADGVNEAQLKSQNLYQSDKFGAYSNKYQYTNTAMFAANYMSFVVSGFLMQDLQHREAVEMLRTIFETDKKEKVKG